MTLKKQLLIVSLCILFLPWAGCQYIREMEKTLRDGQTQALTAHAQAVAITLQNSASVFSGLSSSSALPEKQIYLHQLASSPLVDSYQSDWQGLDFQPLQYKPVKNENVSLELLAGIINDMVYLHFNITDASKDAYNPQRPGLANGDHLILYTANSDNNVQAYALRSSGSGSVTARYLNTDGSIRQEHRLRGVWQETFSGYNVELQLPLDLLHDHFGFSYIDGSANDKATISTVESSESNSLIVQPIARPLKTVADIISLYTKNDLRISVVDREKWLIAQVGSLQQPANNPYDDSVKKQNTPWLLEWFYRLALGSQNFSTLDNALRTGRIDKPEIESALKGNNSNAWYALESQRVGRVTAPISETGQVRGVVVVEQSTDSLMAATNAAFNQLFFTTLSAMAVVVFGLIFYASILSFRIRRLRNAADTAIGDDGKIRETFIQSNAKDEIGDLTRSYGQLLGRLRDYTDYLRTLANKLSHELRTPLAVIKSSLDNLDHAQLDEQAQQYTKRASEGANRLSNILNAMSAATRIEESIQQAQHEQFDLADLITAVSLAYGSTYQNANIRSDIPPGNIPPKGNSNDYQLQGSPDLIVQMLDKLVDNAVDFCPANGSITIGLQRQRQSIRLIVSNTGPLLPEHMQGQLFDSLVSLREDKGTDGKTHLGLGLYIVRLIVDFHQGHIVAKNLEDGSGVAFIIDLPIT